jgi:hypothetical protein
LSAAGGTFSGTVASSSFTTTMANFAGSANFYGTLAVYAGSYGADPQGAVRFYVYANALKARICMEYSSTFFGTGLHVESDPSIYVRSNTQGDVYLSSRVSIVDWQAFSGSTVFSVQDGVSGDYYTKFIKPANDAETGMWLMVKIGSALILKHVFLDGNDSQGAGYRALRVLN